ncbi:aminotransferase ALD1, chloroplastic-like [Vigna angularis]|uniref:aminotransferase ALD1, chloroplastic-like n=1 Tax=Phaseolus angularis TaxID=3914 RepID=UPI000809ECF3|nr:aminotransferase ALD1, chloroplastic-like [Vigna angularis]XP_052728095.1 aminotransferase ALD1, chloroplastic-like [Vigna angularis]
MGPNLKIVVHDPSFSAYIDSSVIIGQAGKFVDNARKYKNIEYMTCGPQTNFFTDLLSISRTELIFFNSPNNPNGHAATRKQSCFMEPERLQLKCHRSRNLLTLQVSPALVRHRDLLHYRSSLTLVITVRTIGLIVILFFTDRHH